DVSVFVHNILSTMDIPIVLNGKKLTYDTIFQYNTNMYSIKILDENKYKTSNIQVGGVPVIALDKFNTSSLDINESDDWNYFLKENDLSTNIVIDFSPKTNILPNQSRNRLIVENNRIAKLIVEAAYDAYYL